MTGRHSARVGLPEQRIIAVWDLPTRLFKWSLVVFVLLAFLVSSSHPYGSLFLVHVACGYAVTLLLLFRLAWGFIGGAPMRMVRDCCASSHPPPSGTIRLAAG